MTLMFMKNLRLHDSVQCHGIDGDTWPLGDDDDERTLELEVNKECNVVGTLLTLRQLCEDQESSPSAAAAG